MKNQENVKLKALDSIEEGGGQGAEVPCSLAELQNTYRHSFK